MVLVNGVSIMAFNMLIFSKGKFQRVARIIVEKRINDHGFNFINLKYEQSTIFGTVLRTNVATLLDEMNGHSRCTEKAGYFNDRVSLI